MTTNTASIGILGATGYTGAELLRLLANHGSARVTCMTSERFAGQTIDRVFPHLADRDLPTDYMRIRYIRTLIDRGYGDQVVVSQDICTKTRLTTYGGHGYGHMFRNVVPLMRNRGYIESEIEAILVRTPRRLLSFV